MNELSAMGGSFDASVTGTSVTGTAAIGEWWPRARPHIEKLLDAEVEQQAAYFELELADQPRLRAEVEAFLRADTQHSETLHSETLHSTFEGGATQAVPRLLADLAEDEPVDIWCGRRVGPWRIESVLGRGGMAVVYRVTRQGDGYTQEAALKWMNIGIDSPILRARFRMEQMVLARLRHSGISALIDGGVSDDGRPYVVMELVEGRPLVQYCVEQDLDLERRLELMAEIGRAVAYAHRCLVVHRDLKPSNVLVTADGQAKLLDFGIAKVLDDAEAPPTVYSAPMTPAYASPEQRQGATITTVSDVYALGLLLWQLVAGERCTEWTPDSPAPPPPSSLVTGLAAQAGPRQAKDLDAVVMRCLEEHPDDRYPSAEALVADLENLLATRPVTARKISGFERLRRWAWRNRVAASAIGAAVLFLVVGIVFSSIFGYWAHLDRRAAEQEANKSRAAMIFVDSLLATSSSSAEAGSTITVRELLTQAQDRIDDDLELQPELQLEVLPLLVRIYRSFSLHAEAVAMAEQEFELVRRHDPDVVQHALAEQRLGFEYVAAGRPHLAAEHLNAALGLLKAELGEQAPEVLDAMRVLSYSVAVRPFSETLELRRQVLEGELLNAAGQDHPRVAQALNDHARTLYFDGRLDDAASQLEAAYDMRRRLGQTLLDLSVPQSNLSMVRLAQGRFHDAETAAREALRLAIEAEGRGHTATTTPLLHLGAALRAQGRHLEAMARAEEATAIRRQYQPGHTRLADALLLLGSVQCDAGDYEEAEISLGETRDIRASRFTATNWRVGVVDGERGRCLALDGRVDEARALLESGLALVTADLVEDSPVAQKISRYLDEL